MINVSGYRRVVLATLVLPVILVAIYYGYWYAKSLIGEARVKQSAAAIPSTTTYAPYELSYQFDPSVNAGIYDVKDIDMSSGRVTLIIQWPVARKGSMISPTISCPIWDSKVFDVGAKVPRYMSGAEMLKVMGTTPKDQQFFTGVCNTINCETMESGCSLTITPEKLYE